MNTQIENIEGLLQEILAEHNDLFLVNIKIKPTNNIKVYLDGDAGVTIQTCVNINRKLYKLIEEKAWFTDGDFSLEVSSPGIDEPIKLNRQYKKNIGRSIEITDLEDKTIEGIIKEVTDTIVIIENTTGKGKKAVTTNIEMTFDKIKKAIIQVKF